MPDIKKIAELTLSIILGMVIAYLIVWVLQLAGLVNAQLSDTWGVLLGIVGVVLTINSISNAKSNRRIEQKFNELFEQLTENKKKDDERDVVINKINSRVIRLEEWRKDVEDWKNEAKGFETRLRDEIRRDIDDLKKFFMDLLKNKIK